MNRGRHHTTGEKLLMAQIAEEFARKKRELGARKAANELNVSLASFYNYANGTDLPRLEVLRDAQKKWGITWKLIDPSKVLRSRKSPKQYVLSFLEALREENVEVSKIGPAKIRAQGESVLQIILKVRFPA